MNGTASVGWTRTLPSRADPPQKRERLAVAAEHHVLAVVDELAGLAVGEGGRASAELRPRIEDEHAHAALGQQRRRAQPGEPAADDDHGADPGLTGLAIAGSDSAGLRMTRSGRQRSQVDAAISARRGRGIRTTRREYVVVARARSGRGSRE